MGRDMDFSRENQLMVAPWMANGHGPWYNADQFTWHCTLIGPFFSKKNFSRKEGGREEEKAGREGRKAGNLFL